MYVCVCVSIHTQIRYPLTSAQVLWPAVTWRNRSLVLSVCMNVYIYIYIYIYMHLCACITQNQHPRQAHSALTIYNLKNSKPSTVCSKVLCVWVGRRNSKRKLINFRLHAFGAVSFCTTRFPNGLFQTGIPVCTRSEQSAFVPHNFQTAYISNGKFFVCVVPVLSAVVCGSMHALCLCECMHMPHVYLAAERLDQLYVCMYVCIYVYLAAERLDQLYVRTYVRMYVYMFTLLQNALTSLAALARVFDVVISSILRRSSKSMRRTPSCIMCVLYVWAYVCMYVCIYIYIYIYIYI
jgi:hypothetical protein